MFDKDLYTRTEACRLLKMSVTTIKKLDYRFLHPLKGYESGRIYYRREDISAVALRLGKKIETPTAEIAGNPATS